MLWMPGFECQNVRFRSKLAQNIARSHAYTLGSSQSVAPVAEKSSAELGRDAKLHDAEAKHAGGFQKNTTERVVQ